MSSSSKISLKFLTSPKKEISSHKSSLSENRYNPSTEETKEYQNMHEFSLKEILPNKANIHSRVLSQPIDILTPEILFGHKRQKSLGQKPLGQLFDTSQRNTPKIEENDNESRGYYSHSRKISDCDIVVYAENDLYSSNDVKRSLPVFGNNPCSAYCKDCDREVFTRVEFAKKTAIPFNLLDLFSSFFACCGEPT